MPTCFHQTRVTPARCAALAAAAGALALAAGLTACTGTASSSTARPAAADVTDLAGAGSTFDAPFFNLAFPAYQQAHLSTGISYDADGSSAGITRFAAGQVNFGATDVPASAADLAGARGGPALQVPVDLGAVAVAYNVPRSTAPPLRLTGPVLAEIFLGQITKWDDPALTALNPGAGPARRLHHRRAPLRRQRHHLHLQQLPLAGQPRLGRQVGTGRSLHWPAGYAADGNPGVAPPSTHPLLHRLRRALLHHRHRPGLRRHRQPGRQLRHPHPAAIAADAAAKPAITPADFSIVNQPGPAAYPICGYSWVADLRPPAQPGRRAGPGALLGWLTHAGQSYAAALGYVPLPPAVQHLATTTLTQVTGPAGTPLTS